MSKAIKGIWYFLLVFAFIMTCFITIPDTAKAGGATEPPKIQAVRVVNPNVQKPGVVYVDIDFTENGIGVDSIGFQFTSTTGHFLGGTGYFVYPTGASAYSGTVRKAVPVPSNSREETYIMNYIGIMDRALNLTSYTAEADGYFYTNGVKTSRVPEFYVKDEFDVEMEIAITNPQLVSRLTNMSEGKTAKILIDSSSNGVFPKAAFDAIKGKDKTVVIYRDGLQWLINGKDIIKLTKDVNLNITMTQVDGSEYGVSDQLVSVEFQPNGELPGKATIRLKSDYLYNIQGITGKLYLYYVSNDGIQEETGNFNLNMDGTDKWCYFDVTHNSKFLISNKKLSAIAVKSITLNKTALILAKDNKETLKATISPSNATDKSVKWMSSDTSVATVSGGEVTAKGAGKATITATSVSNPDKKATCTVTVPGKTVNVTGVSLSKSSVKLETGKSVKLFATIKPETATDKRVTWKSSNEKIVKVDSSGNVTGMKTGRATITVKTANKSKTAKCTVTVVNPVTSILIPQSTVYLKKGASATLAAVPITADGSKAALSWKSSDPKTVSVNSKGKIKALKTGTATIAASAENGKSVKITVAAGSGKPPESVNVMNPPANNTMKVGENLKLEIGYVPSNAQGVITFKSNNAKVLSVNAAGHLKALKKGDATITVTMGSKKETLKITVK